MQNKFYPEHPAMMSQSHKGPVYCIKFSKDGNYCMSGSQDRHAILWNPSKNLLVKSYKCHNYQISALDISNDNNNFITGGSDKIVFLWDVVQGKCKRKYLGHLNRITSLSYNNDCSMIVSGSYDTTLRFWDIKSNDNKPIDIIKGFKDSISKIQIRQEEIYVSSIDGQFKVFDVRKGSVSIDRFSQPVQKFAISSDKSMLAVSCFNGKIFLVQKQSGQILKTFAGHICNNFSIQLKFTSDDGYLITGSQDCYIYIYDLLKCQYTKRIRAHSRVVSAMDIKNKYIITGGHDGKIVYWK